MKKMNILGIKMDCISYKDMFQIYDHYLSNNSSRSFRIAVINVHICVSSLFNKKLRDLYNSADLVGIDSMPFCKWARTFYNKESDHFYAPKLLSEVSQKAKEKGYTFFLYGGFPGAPDKMETYLNNHFEGITIVGKYSPPFRKLIPTEDEDICEMINNAKPDFLWIGLGSPKQDIWIYEHQEKIHNCIIIPSGATFDFYSGRIKQAPNWLRELGFEWLFRLTQDFQRLWVRYTIYNIVFIFAFFLQILKIISFDQDGYLKIFGHSISLGNSLLPL